MGILLLQSMAAENTAEMRALTTDLTNLDILPPSLVVLLALRVMLNSDLNCDVMACL